MDTSQRLSCTKPLRGSPVSTVETLPIGFRVGRACGSLAIEAI